MNIVQYFNLQSFQTSWAQRDKPIDWTEPGSTSGLAQVDAKVECWIRETTSYLLNPQPPGSFPHATRVAAHGK